MIKLIDNLVFAENNTVKTIETYLMAANASSFDKITNFFTKDEQRVKTNDC